ncbi:30S ribosomal protein S5 [candidate division WWE3 bacterium RIFOXYC1_FULL_39_7]|uniref:Small ribosomal subunit protein uS5 n=2 Tax=Katanobacteria TaxID=422282 RepID=A0A1F4X497_UNCKA|nr:MAG: 30S ribosomal protein S5 [candidate division WWE3 bacterium RIFOXYC1_FULL_39_7]OGC76485.1 MAG: 30S ribosomal protein S5 [candidate division WWE3 bacterium RIFOXYD1_FULL_39_9]
MRKEQTGSKISEYIENVIQIKRVSKKTQGGSNVSFTALVVIGNKNGTVGTGYGKGKDVTTAISKAIAKAKKELVTVFIKDGTIVHEVLESYGSANVLLKPAPKGAGIIAGGSVRTVVELAGIKDISAKMLGSNNKICNIRCTLKALQKFKSK